VILLSSSSCVVGDLKWVGNHFIFPHINNFPPLETNHPTTEHNFTVHSQQPLLSSNITQHHHIFHLTHHHLTHHHLTHHHHLIHHFIQHHHSTPKILQTSSLPHTFTTQISSHSLPIFNIHPQNPPPPLQFSLPQPPNHQFPLLSPTLQNLILFKISQKNFRLRRVLRAALRARPPADASGVRLRRGAPRPASGRRMPALALRVDAPPRCSLL